MNFLVEIRILESLVHKHFAAFAGGMMRRKLDHGAGRRFLGAEQGKICLLKQVFCRGDIKAARRHADRGRYAADISTRQDNRVTDRSDQFQRELHGFLARCVPRQDVRELISAKARDRTTIAGRRCLHAVCCFHQHGIPCRMSEHVIQGLEAVQVDQSDNRQFPIRAALEEKVYLLEEAAAVRQAGQGI